MFDCFECCLAFRHACELVDVENGSSRVVLSRTWPLDTVSLELCVGDTCVLRGDSAHLVEDILGGLPLEVLAVAHLLCNHLHDFPVELGLSRCILCLSESLDTAFCVGLGTVFLCVAGSRKDNICVSGGFGLEDILDNKELTVLHCLFDHLGVRIRDNRVFTHQVHTLDLVRVLVERVEHFRNVETELALRDGLDAPVVCDLLCKVRVHDREVAGVYVRQCSHITGSLNIVLTAECVDTASRLSDVSKESLDECDRANVVDTNGVLGDTETVDECGLVLALVEPLKSLLDGLLWDSTDLCGVLDGVFVLSDTCFEVFVSESSVLDEVVVNPVVLDDVLHETVEELDISSRSVLDVKLCLLCSRRAARVADDDVCSLFLCLHDSACGKRVCLKVVGTNDENEICDCKVVKGVGGCTGTKDLCETGDGRCVAETCTVVDVWSL